MSAAVNLDAACEALFSMNPDVGYEQWIRIGIAAKAAGLSFDDFNAWSCSASNYGGKRATADTWNSFKPNGGITEKSLYYYARQSGWQGPANDVRQGTSERKSSSSLSADISRIWSESEPASSDHHYIRAKQGEATNIRMVVKSLKGWGRYRAEDLRGWLVVPVFAADDSLTSLQFIAPDGRKLNAWGCKMDGTFTLGSISPEQTVHVVEGIGHAWSLHGVTGNPCVVSFGMANIAKAVARVQAAGGRPLIIPDRGAEHQALLVAARMGCRYALLPEDLPLKRDVNDLFVERGGKAVEEVLANVITPDPANDNVIVATRDDDRRRLQQEENERLQQLPFSVMPPALSVEDMVDDCVWITAGGQVGSLSEPKRVLTFAEYKDLTASSSSIHDAGEGKAVKTALHASVWRRRHDRKTVHTRTFRAGAAALCNDPDGLTAFNSWRPIKREDATVEVSPFLEHLNYLFVEQAERDAFLDWLAHLEQKPEELPHYGWLHIADNTGTGRNWLSSLLARVWRGYVAPNVDLPALLESSFNGQLSGRILAIVDEVQEGGGENPYRHSNKLKSLVNAEYRDINPKFGRQFREHNSCRWLVFLTIKTHCL